MSAGRPKGMRVVVCDCGWRVTGRGQGGTCASCGAKVRFPRQRPRPKKKAKKP